MVTDTVVVCIEHLRKPQIHQMTACCKKWYEGGKGKSKGEGLLYLGRDGL